MSTRYLRLHITGNWGNHSITQLSQVRFFGAPIEGAGATHNEDEHKDAVHKLLLKVKGGTVVSRGCVA